MKLKKWLNRRKKIKQNKSAWRNKKNINIWKRVKIIGNTELPHGLSLGEEGLVSRIDPDGYILVEVSPSHCQWVAECDLELC